MRSRRGSRYALHRRRSATSSLILALPFSAIVYYTFRDGLGPVWEALTDPSFVSAFKLTLLAVGIAVPQTRSSELPVRWRSSGAHPSTEPGF